MNYGKLLSRAWNIIWEHKFLILLGLIVALGSGGGGGASSGGNMTFNRSPGEGPQMPWMPEMPQLPDVGPAVAGLIVLAIIVFALLALAFWVVSTVARGGLIAGANAAEEGAPSSFGKAWNAGWRKGWRLLGIGILPAIPTFILAVIGIGVGAAAGGFAYLRGQDVVGIPFVGVGVILVGLACVLVPLAVILGLARTFANRACMLEDLGVFGSYRRGLEVLFENFGPALVLFLIQIGIGIALAVVGFLPGILLALCCLLWPLLLLVQGAVKAYFSTLWTLAWRSWTGSQGAEELGSQGAEELGSQGAEELGSEGAEELGSEGAEELGSQGAEEQAS